MRIDAGGSLIHWLFIVPFALASCAGSGDGSGTSAPAPVLTPPSTPPAVQTSRYSAPALDYLTQNAGRFGLGDPKSELVFVSENADERNYKHVRFQQVLNGVPIWRRDIIVHLNDRDEGYDATAALMTGLGRFDVTPHISTDAARAAAAQAKGDGWQPHESTLYVYMYDLRPRLAYEVTLMRGLERWFVFVDARDGSVIDDMSGMPSKY